MILDCAISESEAKACAVKAVTEAASEVMSAQTVVIGFECDTESMVETYEFITPSGRWKLTRTVSRVSQ